MILDLFHTFRFSFEEVAPGLPEIRLFLKTAEPDEDHPVNVSIREIMPKLNHNPDIAGGYIIRRIEEVNLDTGSQIKAYMKEASHLALFVCTAGKIFSELATQYNKQGAYLEAFVTDAIGSLTVENAMNKIQAQLETSLQESRMKISNRYSPGYCNWPLSNQPVLFNQIGKTPVNVSLTESCLMLPVKSISGIIGIGQNIRKRAYACRICKNKNCTYRKIINHTTS
jgi:hypothetical protein